MKSILIMAQIRFCHIALLLIIMTTFFVGCVSKKLFEQTHVDSSEQLGSVHITLFPPVRYEEYKTALQPTFKLTEEEALKAVLPSTLKRYSYDGRSTGFKAEVNLPYSSLDKEETKRSEDKVNEDGSYSSSNETNKKETTTSKSGDIPKANNSERSLSKEEITYDNAPLGTDPMLQYWTATALYQEVQLINKYYSSIGFDKNYVPYVVRLQVSTLPRVRNAPYDTIVDINFSLQGKQEMLPPVIYPMLVTDSIETRTNKLSVQQVKDLSLALTGMVKGIGFGTSFNDYQELIKAAFGKDYNSLLTVARIGDNTLRVRLGAMQQASSAYAIIPKNNTISLVVMVPDDYFENNNGQENEIYLEGTSWAQFADVKTGKYLKSKYGDDGNNNARIEGINKIFTEFGLGENKIKPTNYLTLIQSVLTSDTTKLDEILNRNPKSLEDGTQKKLSEKTKITKISKAPLDIQEEPKSVPILLSDNGPSSEASSQSKTNEGVRSVVPIPDGDGELLKDFRMKQIMVRLAGFFSDSGFDYSKVRLPFRDIAQLCIGDSKDIDGCKDGKLWLDETSAISLLDDGSKTAVSLMPIGNVRDTNLSAKLYATTLSGQTVTFPARTILAKIKTNELLLTFTSMTKWNIKKPTKIVLVDSMNKKDHKRYEFKGLKYEVGKDSDPLKIKLVNKNGNNFITEATVHFQIVGDLDSNNYSVLIVENARINKAVSMNWLEDKQDKNKKVIAENVIIKNGNVKLALSNLVDEEEIKIYGKAKDSRETNKLTYTVKLTKNK